MNIKISKDLIYDESNNLKLDLYESEESKNTIILVHGGGWFKGDKSKEESLASRLVKDGFRVAVPNYRLAPEHVFPTARDDIFSVYKWLINDKKIKKETISALGASSGGNLVIELSLKFGIPVVSWSGIIDTYSWIKEHVEVIPNKNHVSMNDQPVKKIDQNGKDDPFYKWFILNYVNNDLDLLSLTRVVDRVSKDSGPIFMANSLGEFTPVSGVLELQKKLIYFNIPSEVKLIKGVIHGEGYEDIVYDNSVNFLKEYLDSNDDF